jgi:hypothetical protein
LYNLIKIKKDEEHYCNPPMCFSNRIRFATTGSSSKKGQKGKEALCMGDAQVNRKQRV